MATETLTRLIDDMEGGVAEETIPFSIDGVEYTIDLNKKNAKKLRDALSPFIEKAERVGGRKKGAGPRKGYLNGIDSKAVRQWAKKNKIAVNATGRIPQAIIDQYLAATS